MASSGALVKILRSGQGHQGYCKLCSFDDPRFQDEFDKRVLDYTSTQTNEWLVSKGLKKVNRQTIYSHREHVRNPQDKLVQATKRRAMQHGSQAPRTTDDEFLDAVIQFGHANAVANPDNVTIEQALKAVGIKKQANTKGNAHQTLVAIFTGTMTPEDIIEGEAQEL